MAIKTFKPTSPGRRFRTDILRTALSKNKPEKSLTRGQTRISARSLGTITVRRRGGGAKRKVRIIDFKRDKKDIEATVASIEYDPNRSSDIALLHYADGEKRYIIAPYRIKIGDKIVSKDKAEVKIGNAMQINNVPTGTVIHNVELHPGKGAQFARSAGSQLVVVAKEGKYVQVKMPSKERRLILGTCLCTVGQVSNIDLKNVKLGKAGRSRLKGRRPKVRGVAMSPNAHPHGGGEGKSGIGMASPKTPWGKKTLGKKTRTRKHTDKYILKDRRG